MLTHIELKILEELKARNIVTKMDPATIQDGALFVCGDCDRIGDIMKWHTMCYRVMNHNRRPRFQEFKLNGGPLLLGYPMLDSEVETRIIARYLMVNQIGGGLRLKRLSHIELFGHWPCGQAKDWGLDLPRALTAFADAADAMRLTHPEADVVCRYHFHICREGMETRDFAPALWREHSTEVLRSVHN